MNAGAPETPADAARKTAFDILLALSVCHLLNDALTSLLPSIYPLLKDSLHLNFAQIGLITLAYQLTASLLQPLVGLHTDRRPSPNALAIGMAFTLIGLLALSRAQSFHAILIAAALVGSGSSVFHPESSRVVRMASGGKYGLAQSVFQLGGNAGLAVGPLLAAFIVLPMGQTSIARLSIVALFGIIVLAAVGRWVRKNGSAGNNAAAHDSGQHSVLPPKKVVAAISILLALVFSKFIYLASLSSYYTFYLMTTFHVSVRSSQLYLFVFLAAVALGTIAGGPIGDRIGRKSVIWWSILGVLPFSLVLPYANLFWTGILSVIIGLGLASAFPAIIVYAQELVPGRVGMISGLFFGFAFGMGGLGAALLGELADLTSIRFVYIVCSFLPVVGLLAALLPNIEPSKLGNVQGLGNAVPSEGDAVPNEGVLL
jgi:MFS transporter, FSR family, fosmidomycin resistance protein